MRISDWSSDVVLFRSSPEKPVTKSMLYSRTEQLVKSLGARCYEALPLAHDEERGDRITLCQCQPPLGAEHHQRGRQPVSTQSRFIDDRHRRSEEHTSELQSLMRISYAVFCLKKKKERPITYKSDKLLK